MSAGRPALAFREVSYAYGARLALDEVSFAVPRSAVTLLLGPNGAGKTTLFAVATRLFSPKSGQISIEGRDLAAGGAAALRPLGIVFQQPTLDLDLTVRQNLRYFAALHGLSRADADARIEAELCQLGLGADVDRVVRQLSGGYRRRVEIARALLHRPSILLLDEPTVGLDIPTRTMLIEHLHERAARDAVAVLWATHLVDEAVPGDRLIVMNRGRVVAQGSVAEVLARTRSASIGEAFAQLTAEAA